MSECREMSHIFFREKQIDVENYKLKIMKLLVYLILVVLQE